MSPSAGEHRGGHTEGLVNGGVPLLIRPCLVYGKNVGRSKESSSYRIFFTVAVFGTKEETQTIPEER